MSDNYKVDLKFPPRVLSGVQPTLNIHLGHYFGALKQHIELHHEYPGQAFFLIADYHSLTKGLQKNDTEFNNSIIELATIYLSLGLDPSKSFLYRQSDIKELFELTWIFNCITSYSSLKLAPTFKDAVNRSTSRSAGLFTYPVLMAADILSVKASIIPVGKDQFPYIERARDIAETVNKLLSEDFFPIPAPIAGEYNLVKGIDGKKMSFKNGNYIKLFLTYNELKRIVAKIVTDSKLPDEPKNYNECNVFYFYSMVASKEKVQILKDHYINGTISYADAKTQLRTELQEYFSDFTEKYYKLKQQPDYIMDILRDGYLTVRREAHNTLLELRSRLGIRK